MGNLEKINNMSEHDVEEWYALSSRTWGEVLDDTAAEVEHKEAIVFGSQRLTYGELRTMVNQLAKGLIKLGVNKEDKVAIWMTNNVEWVVAQFAIYKIGAVMVPINTRYKADEVKYILQQGDVTTLFTMKSFLGNKINVLELLKKIDADIFTGKAGQLELKELPLLKNVILLEGDEQDLWAFSFHQVLGLGESVSDEELNERNSKVEPDSLCQIMYTSGTTGKPKGAMITHRQNQCGLTMVVKRINYSYKDKILAGTPFFSNFGCMLTTAVAVFYGATLIVQETFEPTEAIHLIEKEKITVLMGTPSMFIMLYSNPELAKHDISSLRGGVVGGSPVPMATMASMVERLGIKEIINGYGLVEGGGVSSATLQNDPLAKVVETIGKPLPFCTISILDLKTGSEAEPGFDGEIVIKELYPGSHTMKGYYKMPEKTREAIDELGRLHTGDIGHFDNEGYLRITGRLKDMYIVGGFNVYPAEVEDILYNHPKVKQAAVIGVPDDRLGEVGMAFIQLKEGCTASEEEIIEFCRERMANIKVPRFVRFIDEMPLTGSGKIQKFVLKEMISGS